MRLFMSNRKLKMAWLKVPGQLSTIRLFFGFVFFPFLESSRERKVNEFKKYLAYKVNRTEYGGRRQCQG